MKIILYMATPGGMTGGPRRMLTLAEVLDSQGLSTCVASESGSEILQTAAAQEIDTAIVDVAGVLTFRHGAVFAGGLLFRLRVLLALLRQNWRFLRCVQKRKADVIWTRGSKGIAFAGLGALLSRRPLIWDVDYELPSRGIVRWLHRFGLAISRAVVFQYTGAGEAIFGQNLARRFSGKCHALVPGVELARLAPYREKRAGRLSSGEDPFTILQVGTICDRKNQRLLIEALRLVDREALPVPLHIQFAGGVFDEAYAEALHRTVAEAGLEDTVEFLGWRDDVHELMAAADAVAMPSRDEGVPNAVQEAMYLGVPVIVSAAGGMPEIVEHGRTGWVLPADDPRAWAERIAACAMSEDRCTDVGEAAAGYAAAHFGTAEWGARYAEVIRSVVQR